MKTPLSDKNNKPILLLLVVAQRKSSELEFTKASETDEEPPATNHLHHPSLPALNKACMFFLMNYTQKIHQIEELVGQLKKLSPYFAGHTKKPLEERGMELFETQHQVRLPEDFRMFLLHFGDEAILPHVTGSRALPLEKMTKNPIHQSLAEDLSAPFLFKGREAAALEWNDEKDNYTQPNPLSGTLCLGSGGCDTLWLLVVSGTDHGKIWSFGASSEKQLHPKNMEFLDWCIDGLEKKLPNTKASAIPLSRLRNE